jgi:hypothetical protein
MVEFGVPFPPPRQELSDSANVTGHGTSVPRLKFRWLILLAYAMAHSDFGEVVGE